MQTDERTSGQWWHSTGEMTRVSIAALREMGTAALRACGATEEDARYLVDIQLDKSIQGDHARGIWMLPRIARNAKRGDLDLKPEIRIVRETTASALVDGGPKASGYLVCRHAMDLAINKAREHGVGWVGARANGGILTPFVQQAADAGMVSMVWVQSIPTVAPHGGVMPLLGNAPVAYGVPAGRHAPVIIDMSITQTSASGVALAALQGQPIPEGFVIDRNGNPTTDPDEFYDPEWTAKKGVHVARGSLLSLGANHKGYALVFITGLLSMVLTDTSPPWELGNDNPNPGVFGTLLVAVNPEAFASRDAFLKQVDDFIERLKHSPRKAGVDEILYPGEKSQQLKAQRKVEGWINIPAEHYRDFVAGMRELGVAEITK